MQPTLPTHLGRVLVVDDESAIRLFMERALSLSGFRVHAFGDGPSAAEFFAAHADEIDLVVMDLMMPTMCGRELAERLIEYRADVPLVLMSGHSEGEVREQFIDLPLAAVLPKPFTPKQLVEVVKASFRSERKRIVAAV